MRTFFRVALVVFWLAAAVIFGWTGFSLLIDPPVVTVDVRLLIYCLFVLAALSPVVAGICAFAPLRR